MKKPVFRVRDLLWWKVLARLHWDPFDQGKVPDSLSLFLKSEKTPGLLSIGKGREYKPFHDFRPVPLAYPPQAQISNYSGPSPIHKILL
jgi:hypothetical protein